MLDEKVKAGLSRRISQNLLKMAMEPLEEVYGENFNLYELLKISKDANQSQIKKAYRKLALRVHPDKNKSENATKEFFLHEIRRRANRTDFNDRGNSGDSFAK